MTTYSVINVKDMDTLQSFYDDSSLTLEGLAEETIQEYIDWLNDNCGLQDNINVYIVKGELMNSVYDLYGDNRYPDDLTIVIIKLNDIKSIPILSIKRFAIGARWFDDVVDNNKQRRLQCGNADLQ